MQWHHKHSLADGDYPYSFNCVSIDWSDWSQVVSRVQRSSMNVQEGQYVAKRVVVSSGRFWIGIELLSNIITVVAIPGDCKSSTFRNAPESIAAWWIFGTPTSWFHRFVEFTVFWFLPQEANHDQVQFGCSRSVSFHPSIYSRVCVSVSKQFPSHVAMQARIKSYLMAWW